MHIVQVSWTSKHEDTKPGKYEVKLYDDEGAVAVRKVETPALTMFYVFYSIGLPGRKGKQYHSILFNHH